MDSSPFRVRVVEETGSTNADLMAAGIAGEPHGAVLVARHQTAGRGRLDRRWESPAGANLLMSVLFREGLDPIHGLTQRVAVAAAEACEEVAGVATTLKWPNDLLVGDAKLGGILAERSPHAPGGVAGGSFVVVGLGLNVRWAPPDGACLGTDVDPDRVLESLLKALGGEEAASWEAYVRRLATIGQTVRVELAGGSLIGTATGVEPDGRLVVVDPAGVEHRIDTGDVVRLR